MSLAQLQIQNLRNIASLRINLDSHLNFIYGLNGAGKTSLLEALYLLSTGHSFRTREISPLISHEKDNLVVFARTDEQETVSIQKSLNKPSEVRINSQVCKSTSELAFFMPCQVFYQDIFQIIDAGPSIRRTVMDWGLFHVKQNYFSVWKNYRRALKQRNSLLRQKATPNLFEPWNKILADLGEQLDLMRKAYCLELNTYFKLELAKLSNLDCSLQYYKGWDKRETGAGLFSILSDSYKMDMQRQFTHYGAHQADLIIEINDAKAKLFLSRGQQKIILFALKLAQLKLLKKPSLILCDDITSELDKEHLKKLIDLIAKTEGQFVITAINQDSLELGNYKHSSFIADSGIINQVNAALNA
ncbi:MAG: DNA replication/repair protein RecF [Proteobacteria bacterium]|nr:DNA replication/repair protein RecF [Pseudomonadota bacterium]